MLWFSHITKPWGKTFGYLLKYKRSSILWTKCVLKITHCIWWQQRLESIYATVKSVVNSEYGLLLVSLQLMDYLWKRPLNVISRWWPCSQQGRRSKYAELFFSRFVMYRGLRTLSIKLTNKTFRPGYPKPSLGNSILPFEILTRSGSRFWAGLYGFNCIEMFSVHEEASASNNRNL